MARIVVIDDNIDYWELIKMHRLQDHEVVLVNHPDSLASAVKAMRGSGDHAWEPEVAFVDMLIDIRGRETTGIETLEILQSLYPLCKAIIVTEHTSSSQNNPLTNAFAHSNVFGAAEKADHSYMQVLMHVLKGSKHFSPAFVWFQESGRTKLISAVTADDDLRDLWRCILECNAHSRSRLEEVYPRGRAKTTTILNRAHDLLVNHNQVPIESGGQHYCAVLIWAHRHRDFLTNINRSRPS
jgi:DNA-binding NarL/FixJ family response regulator